MKIVYAGIESSGKSLKLAMTVVDLVFRNSEWRKKSGKIRPIRSNLRFSEKFFDWATKEMEVPIEYWDRLDDLTKFDQCDVVIDEIGNYFDSRLWQDLSLDTRVWITQGAKSGIEIYASAQDFAQVDKAFRRLTNHLYEIKKYIGSPRPAATKPPVQKIWGVCLARELDPRSYNEDKKKFASNFSLPTFFTIQKKYCDIFDTTQKIKRSKLPALKHETRTCEYHVDNGGNGSCNFCKISHV